MLRSFTCPEHKRDRQTEKVEVSSSNTGLQIQLSVLGRIRSEEYKWVVGGHKCAKGAYSKARNQKEKDEGETSSKSYPN